MAEKRAIDWISLFAENQEKFPVLNVKAEVEKAINWLDRHPERKYTDWSRFFGNWCARAVVFQKTNHYLEKLEKDLKGERNKRYGLEKRLRHSIRRLKDQTRKTERLEKNLLKHITPKPFTGWTPEKRKAAGERTIRQNREAREKQTPKTFWGRLLSKHKAEAERAGK